MRGILALLDEIDAGGVRHAFDHDFVDSPRGLDRGEAERFGDGSHRPLGSLLVESHLAAEEKAWIVVAKHKVRVCDRRPSAAAAIAGRSRVCARRMRPDTEQADFVDRGNRAAARADLDHVDDGRLDRQAGALLEAMHAPGFQHRRDFGPAVLDQAGLGGRPAHVEGDDVLLAGALAEERRCQGAARRARLEQADGEGARDCGRDEATRGMHQPQGALESLSLEFALETGQVAIHQRLHVGVRAGRHAALILPQLGDHLRGDRHRDFRQFLANDAGGDLLVCGIAIGVEEADGDRLDTLPTELAGRVTDLLLRESRNDLPVAVDALGNFETVASLNERLGKCKEQIVDVVALLGAHLQKVAEALRRDETELCSLALDDGVCDQRRSVDDLADVGQGQPRIPGDGVETVESTDGRVFGCRQSLVEADVAALGVRKDEVGERAANIESDAIAVLVHGILPDQDVGRRRQAAVVCDRFGGAARAVQNGSLNRRPISLAPLTSLLLIASRSASETMESEKEMQAETVSSSAGSARDTAIDPTPRLASSSASAKPCRRTDSRR